MVWARKMTPCFTKLNQPERSWLGWMTHGIWIGCRLDLDGVGGSGHPRSMSVR